MVNPIDLYTYINPVTGKGSCLDLCFTTPNIAANTKVTLGTDVGSDHCTVEIELQLLPVITESIGIKKFKKRIDKRDMDLFFTSITLSLLDMPNSLDAVVNYFTNRIYNAAAENIPMTSGKRICKKRTPWWNSDCSRLVAERRRARKILEKHPNQNNLDDYNRKTAAAKEICSKSKKKSFQTYVSTLQYDTPIKTVWSKIKSFKSNYVQQTY